MSRPPAHLRLLWAATGAAASAIARGDPPSLQAFSDQSRQLYAHARLGLVRVRLPTPQWLARENRLRQFMAKWGNQLDPAVRERLMEEQEEAAQAATRSPSSQSTVAGLGATGGLTTADPPRPSDRVLVATGLLVDAAGHAVFPLYIDRSDLAASPTLQALTGDGSSAHLAVWTAASADVGLVVRPDGTFAGFGFGDDFLSAGTARPIVDQLVADGTVRRPVLGVTGVAVRRDDVFDSGPAGTADAGGPSAVYVRRVDAGSPAAAAGVRPGDVILSVAGQPVGPRTFAAVITARRGATVLRVRRGTRTVELTVDLRLE